MRNLNIKKLVAVAAGVALVGSALAPMASAISLEKSDLISSTGSPIVDVVVGKNAAVSDAVWAGNIAVAVGQKAYTDSQVAVGAADCSGGATPSVTGLTVDLSVGGTTSVSGGKTFFNDMYSGTTAQEANFNNQSVTEASVPSLYYNGSKSYTYNGTAYTTAIQERLYFTADIKFDEVTNKALVAEITSGNLKYNLNLGSGIPRYEVLTGTTNFSDDGNDNVRIPMFGTDYLVKSITTTYIELIQTSGETQYSEGDRISDLEGYDGEKYYVEIGPGGTVGSTQKITLSLYKEDGTLVKTSLFGTGDVVFYSDDTGQSIVSTLVNISEILKTVVSDAEVYTPTILVGSSRILLYTDKGYPYDSTKQDDTYDWEVKLNFDGNYLKDINIQNKSKYDFVGTDALKVGEEAAFPNSVGAIKFLGLQLPGFSGVSKTERTTVVEVKDGVLKYKDATYEATHTLPLYTFEQAMSDEGTATSSIDGKTIWYKINTTDTNLLSNTSADGSGTGYGCVGDLNYINGEMVSVRDVNMIGAIKHAIINGTDINVGVRIDINGMDFKLSGLSNDSNCVYLTADGNMTFRKDTSSGTKIQDIYYVDANYSDDAPITFEGGSSINHNYEWMIDEVGSTARVWLFFDAQALTTQYTKHINFIGTDTLEDMNFTGSAAVQTTSQGIGSYQFYLPHSQYLPAAMEGDTNYSSSEYFVSMFRIDEDEDSVYDMNFFVDTGTGNLIALPNTQLSTYSYEADYNNGVKYVSESTTATYPSKAYTDFGSYIELSSHNYKMTIPENRPQAEVLVSGTGTTTTVSGGEDLTIAEGQSGSTTGGTKVTVTKINYNATCSGGTGTGSGSCTVTPTAYKNLKSAGNLVTTDTSPSASTHIIVGGWKVNSLAQGVLVGGQTLKDLLTSSGDTVVEKTDSGDIIVAGYNKADTMNAAMELINAIENL
ncbi:MAG: S-layer protein [archaeon]